MWPEIKRKIFHLTALLYVVGIIYLPRATYLGIIGLLLVLAVSTEILRFRRPAFNEWLQRQFGGLFRKKEVHHFCGVTYMLLGVFLTALVTGPLPLAVAALLYLILGDAVASLVGMRLGGPHWPGSTRRVSGSAACFIVCLLIGVVLLRPGYGWHGVVLGAAVATALEWGLLSFDDNLTIPIGAALALLAAYAIPPFVGVF